MKRYVLFGLLLSGLVANAQQYPTDYFRSPLNIPLYLAGNFGECRPNHFHSGIDIKTNGQENLPVYAAADGYISRIKMEPGGFGHGIYITHPNGYTTLYAHLNNFMPGLQRYVKAEQYKKQNWEVDLQLSPDQFPVKKGQQIAWSGNTGASTAPHLHFEIRNTKSEHPLNPLLFGFDVKDNIAPIPLTVGVYNMNESIYEQTPKVIGLKKKGDVYTITDTVMVNSSLAGVSVNINDFMNGSNNSLNYYTADIFMDSVLQGRITLDDIGYDETRYMHAFIDYKTKKLTGNWMQNMFQLPNNRLDHIYSWSNPNNGKLDIADRQAHRVHILFADAFNNKTTVSLYLKYTGIDSTSLCNATLFKANEANHYKHPNVRIELDDKALYDDVCFQFDNNTDVSAYSERFSLDKSYVPVHTSFKVNIKPNRSIGFDSRDKIAMVYSDGKEETGKAAKYEDGGFYTASFRNFGDYRLVMDTEPPVIKSLQKNGANLAKAQRITFKATDAVTSVKTFSGVLDGKWICFEQHGDLFFYTFDEHCSKGKHTLVFTATDENNNKQTLNYTFTR